MQDQNGATETETPELVGLDDLDLYQLWQEFYDPTTTLRIYTVQLRFIDHLRTLLREPDEADEVRFCFQCNLPGIRDHGHVVDDSSWVCDEGCDGHYTPCSTCGGLYSSTTTTSEETEVCETCRDDRWFFCEDCDEWVRNRNQSEHEHGGCDCEPFATLFAVKNAGSMLANDTEVNITLPAGVISDEGIATIANYLRYDGLRDLNDAEMNDKAYRLALDLTELGTSWQTREGNYTKRLSRLAYKKQQMKIPPDVLSRVGDIARNHSTAIDFTVAVTRELNMEPGEFCHDDSCWWQSYTPSRCALKSNGGFAIRTFADTNGWGYTPQGRAWVLPLMYDETRRPQFHPTFETVEPSAFVVFNGYGQLEGYAAARLLAHMTGMTYRKISFSCDPMYVNAGGYLVAPEEIAHRYTDQAISLVVNAHSTLYENERETTDVA